MKKIAYFLSVMFLFTAFAPAAMAKDVKNEKNEKSELTAEEQLRLEQIDYRLAEIKEMDFASMTKAERKEIKGELKDMNKEARAIGDGVYLSVGAIILIVLLLILLT